MSGKVDYYHSLSTKNFHEGMTTTYFAFYRTENEQFDYLMLMHPLPKVRTNVWKKFDSVFPIVSRVDKADVSIIIQFSLPEMVKVNRKTANLMIREHTKFESIMMMLDCKKDIRETSRQNNESEAQRDSEDDHRGQRNQKVLNNGLKYCTNS